MDSGFKLTYLQELKHSWAYSDRISEAVRADVYHVQGECGDVSYRPLQPSIK